MRVDFTLREPGNHHCILSVSMESPPRENETVVIEGEAHRVHSVQWLMDEGITYVVNVLLDS